MNNTNFQTIHQMGQAINDVVRQATGRDAVQNIDMDHITVAQNKHYEETSVSGRMVSFTTKTGGLPLEKCIVQIDPVQDLHGYDHPWPAGGGINKFNPVDIINVGSAYGLTITNNGNGTIGVSGTVTEMVDGKTYIQFRCIYVPETYAGSYFYYFLLSGSADVTTTGFTRGSDGHIPIGIATSNGAVLNITLGVMCVSEQERPTSYAPYSNICPISGWTGCNISHSGADTSDPTVIPISWQSEAGTVYGGTLDVVSGKLVVDRKHINGSGFTKSSTDGVFELVTSEPKKPANNNTKASIISSAFVTAAQLRLVNIPFSIAVPATANYIRIYAPGYVSTEQFQAEFANVDIVYELATTITYQLTSQEIRTLLGVNNIWADTGDIEVTYKDLKELY